MIDPTGLLMIEPTTGAEAPVVDELTRKMAAAYRQARIGNAYKGWHTCVCSARSDNLESFVDGMLTNSLCVHYLARHRSAVPQAELDKVAALDYGEVEPSALEIYGRLSLFK